MSEDEVLGFSSIIKNAIQNSNDKTKAFASHYGIHLGLQSTLRAINSKQFSFLIVSLSLRPAHLIRLIATSASAKVPTALIYAQPKLEDLTEDIFGIRATALTLPLDLKTISDDLDQWVTARKIHPSIFKKVVSKAKKSTKTRMIQEQKVEESKESEKQQPEVVTKPVKKEWDDDFISFTDDKTSIKLDKIDIQVETKQLGAALSNLAMKARSQAKDEVIFEIPMKKEESPSIEPMEIQNEDEIDEDEFLPSEHLSTYRPLTVQQIRPNPNKKPKKKRNKKQKELAK